MTVSTKSQGFSEETVLVTPRLSCWAAGLAQLSKPAAVSSLNPSAGSDWLITSCPRGAVCWEKPPELLSKEGLLGGEIQEEKSRRRNPGGVFVCVYPQIQKLLLYRVKSSGVCFPSVPGWAVPAVKEPGVLALNPAGSWAHGAGVQVGMRWSHHTCPCLRSSDLSAEAFLHTLTARQ